jgi:selenide,water dikinase
VAGAEAVKGGLIHKSRVGSGSTVHESFQARFLALLSLISYRSQNFLSAQFDASAVFQQGYLVTEPVRLTQLAKRAGCAAKQPPGYLFSLLGALPPITDPNVLVGSATADDAAVYKISDDLALVLTTDFFTPIVDAPYDFGAVAAANALSDVYAMGGKPLAALSIVGFPDTLLKPEVLAEILLGATNKAHDAGIAIVGGHTIKSEEPIFGLAVVGSVSPDHVLSNDKAQPGDVLILTKPLGLGIITTAAKNGEDKLGAIREAIGVMTTLNRAAGEVIAKADGVHALTDVTGFGLLGHLRNVVAASKVSARIYLEQVPVLGAAWEYVRAGISPGGTHANHRFLADCVTYADNLSKEDQLVLCDAQTSGGLLVSVAADRSAALLAALQANGVPQAAVVGAIDSHQPGRILVHRSSK